jgi:hypothetical protein
MSPNREGRAAGGDIVVVCGRLEYPLSFTKILGPATSAHLANGGGQDGPFSGCFHCSLGRLYPPLHGVGCMVCSNQQHRTQQASHVHHCLQLGLVWALFHGRIPRTYRGYRAPDMRCILCGCCQARNGATLVQPSV